MDKRVANNMSNLLYLFSVTFVFVWWRNEGLNVVLLAITAVTAAVVNLSLHLSFKARDTRVTVFRGIFISIFFSSFVS